jgi:uncharacterized protein YecE (DUF72 family)
MGEPLSLWPEPTEPEPPRPKTPAGIVVGTSGYSFADWVGPFYPPHLKPSQFLAYYARHFDAVEVNSTYYGIPDPRVIEQMERKTPAGFRFMVKLNHAMTHESSRDPALYRQFLGVIEPLKAAGKYDGLLAQFPFAFRRSVHALQHMKTMRELLPGEPLFVEFRHRSWLEPTLSGELESLDLGFCAVDEPQMSNLMPPVVMRTTPDGYVRFHGRNADMWWEGNRSTRYDYSYQEAELNEWLTRIRELAEQARRTYLFFNNCHAGQAARSAKLMQELLRQQALREF